jgi:hypothetical protein
MKPAFLLAAGALFGLAVIMPIQPVRAQGCPPNAAPVSEDDNVVHCRCVPGFENKDGVCAPVTQPPTEVKSEDARFPPAAANLVNIMDKTTEKLKRPKGGYHEGLEARCNLFFHGIGEELTKLGLPADTGAWEKGLKANQIKARIEKDKTDWNEVNENDVQELANKGVIVVVVSPGHVAVAFPKPVDSKFPGKGGPLLRDGNEHGPETQADNRLHASSWGAIPAHNMFSYKTESSSPKFYVWAPSASPASEQSQYKKEIVAK